MDQTKQIAIKVDSAYKSKLKNPRIQQNKTLKWRIKLNKVEKSTDPNDLNILLEFRYFRFLYPSSVTCNGYVRYEKQHIVFACVSLPRFTILII